MLLHRSKNPIMLGGPGVPFAPVGLQKLPPGGSVGLVGLNGPQRKARGFLGPLPPLWQQLNAITYWNFGDGSKIIEGATATDIEGWKDTAVTNAYDLEQTTAANQPTWVEDGANSHALFNGTQWLERDVGIPAVGDVTIIFTINPAGLAGHKRIIDTSDNSWLEGFHIGIIGSELHVRSGSSSSYDIEADVIAGEKATYAIVISGSTNTAKAYKNGAEMGTFTDALKVLPILASTRASIGSEFGNNPYIGKMYDTQIYGSALTAAEVAAVTAELN